MSRMEGRGGPLAGLLIIEMAGLGPVPLAGLMLAEMGATVLRIERVGPDRSFLGLSPEYDIDRHGRTIVKVDLKAARGVEFVMRLAEKADILVEGFRPGVMERIGLGPVDIHARNPALIYGRMTGFGQAGPLAATAGHDLTYLAWSGLLHAIGHAGGRPVPPLNLVGDFGGGTMFLITGILAALFERSRSGKGQIVDAAMLDGASMLAAPIFAYLGTGHWRDVRGSNLLDSGAPFYDTYATSEGKHMAVACLEPQFFAEFCRLLPLGEPFAGAQYNRETWTAMRDAIATAMQSKTRDEWTAVFAGSDACVAPVLSLGEAGASPHSVARESHVQVGPLSRPAPAPRFSRSSTEAARPGGAPVIETLLEHLGMAGEEWKSLVEAGIAQP